MFNKDILLIDIESTGLDCDKHEIIQLAAVLLDKKTLKEKSSYNIFVVPKHWGKRDPEAMAVNQISLETLKKEGVTLKKAISQFHRKFREDAILAAYGDYFDVNFLKQAFKICHVPWKFDYHYFDVWSVCYTYLALHGNLTNKKRFAGFSLEDLMKKFSISPPTLSVGIGPPSGPPPSSHRHDALVDCRMEAEVFRSIIKELNTQ